MSAMNQQTLEGDFSAALAVFTTGGKLEDFLGFFDDDALMVNEDTPFILDKASYRDHLNFLMSSIDRLEWAVRQPSFLAIDGSGVVSAELTVRGKPKNTGFRQRHGVMTALCYWDGKRWRGAALHTSTLLAHIHHASPG
jgi:hypothetical protein